jgi:hypothetical protein
VVVGTDNIDSLKQYLTVEATYSDSTTRVLDASEYTLSGTLAYPSATVTVDYQGVTDTFTAAVAYDAEVEYLESSGTQYINTGIVVGENDSIVAVAKFMSGYSTTYNTIGDAMAINSSQGSIFLRLKSSAYFVRFGSSSTSQPSASGIYNKNVYVLSKHYFGVNGSELSTPNYIGMPSSSYIIGHIASNTSFVGKLFSFAIKDSNDVARIDLIPVRCGTVGYMYDRVSGTLFGNDGTGDFIVGADV